MNPIAKLVDDQATPSRKTSTKSTVGVIGGGLGGLAAACTLAARGYQVTVFERNTWAGGKAAVWEQDGFRFDMGPTILTLPSVLKRIFAEAGRKLGDELDLVPLDPQWRCFFEDGSTLDLLADIDEMSNSLKQFTGNLQTAKGYRQFSRISQQLNEISQRFFFYRNVGSVKDTLDFSDLVRPSTWRDLWRLRMGRSAAGVVRSCVNDDRVAQMIDHFTQYVGSAPDQSPAVLCGIGHIQTSEGIWYPRGGMAKVPQSLRSLAADVGVRFHFGRQVRKVITERNQSKETIAGLETDSGETFSFDAIVSNSDSVLTHRELLEPQIERRFAKRRDYEPACSGVVLYLGLKKRYDQLLHHNFVFSQDPHLEFEQIYRQGEPADDPTCYVCAPAISDSTVAPPGGESLYILVHTPYLREHHNWKAMLPGYRRAIIHKLERVVGLTNLEDQIVTESLLTPEDIQNRYHVLNGAIYGLASHGKYTGAFKPANRSPDIRGFYLAGGSAHPGPGMPMAMMSGWIAADTLDQDLAMAKA